MRYKVDGNAAMTDLSLVRTRDAHKRRVASLVREPSVTVASAAMRTRLRDRVEYDVSHGVAILPRY